LLFELAPRWAWLRQCGAEVSLGTIALPRLMALYGSKTPVRCRNHVWSAIPQPHRAILFSEKLDAISFSPAKENIQYP
jgi:hypothetical protein